MCISFRCACAPTNPHDKTSSTNLSAEIYLDRDPSNGVHVRLFDKFVLGGNHLYPWTSIVWSDREGWWSGWQSEGLARYSSECGPHHTRMRAEGGPSGPPGFSPMRVVTLLPAVRRMLRYAILQGALECQDRVHAEVRGFTRSTRWTWPSLVCSELRFEVQGSRFLGFRVSWVLGSALQFRVPGLWGSGLQVSGHVQPRAS